MGPDMTLHRLLGEGLDRLVLDAMLRLVGPGGYAVPRAEGEALLAERALGDPSRFFPSLFPPSPADIREQALEQHADYRMIQWFVPSSLRGVAPPNDWMGVRRFAPLGKPRGRVIVLHGAMASRRFPWDSMARRLAQLGFEGLVPSMPDHLDRKPAGEHSGQYLIGGHLRRGLDVIRQGVSDVRGLVRLLRQVGDAPLGVLGFSMGGLIGGWTVTLEPLDFAILAEPAVQLDPIVFDTRLGEVARRSMAEAGWTEEEVRQWLTALSPVWADALLPPERLLLMLPEYDGIVPPVAVERAWERWGRPPLTRYPAGHISLFLMRRAWRDIVGFLQTWCPE
jgi:hypothetical protein